MAQLPPDGQWLIQQIDGEVMIFERDTEVVLLTFDPSDADETAKAQRVIYDLGELTAEQKCFAHFWSGYFYRGSAADQNPCCCQNPYPTPRIRMVPIGMIRVNDKKIKKLDRAKISVYEGDYERGDQFPPILVQDCGVFFTVTDGRHRLQAQRNLGCNWVEVEVR